MVLHQCVCKFSFKFPPCEKVLVHFLQENCFSPECVFKCVFKLQASEKVLGHRLEGNGFSPEHA